VRKELEAVNEMAVMEPPDLAGRRRLVRISTIVAFMVEVSNLNGNHRRRRPELLS
jgi:hypothetical protein